VTDLLDSKIRSFLVELVDAAPPPPELEEIKDFQLGIEVRPNRQRHAHARSGRRWLNGRSALLAGAVVCVAALAVGVAVVANETGSSQVRVPAADSTTQTSRSLASPPAVVTGTEQTLDRADMPSDLNMYFVPSSRVTNYTVKPGSAPHAFVVDGSPVFAVADVTAGGPFDDVANQTYPGVLVLTMPVSGSVGQGISSWYRSDAQLADAPNSLINEWDWPVPRQRWIWTRVPASAEYVTLTYGNDVQLWQRPLDGVAAFSFPIPDAQMNAPASPSDPVPHLVAYAADGTVLGTVDASPR
jgi:hypothetical protein